MDPAREDAAEWAERHRLGIPGVDEEHRTFFDLVRAVEATLAEGDVRGARESLAGLRSYATSHFAHEEAFLEAAGYPDLQRHRAEHAELMRDVTGLEAAGGGAAALAVRMARAWIGQHVLGADRRSASWLERGDGAARAAHPAPA